MSLPFCATRTLNLRLTIRRVLLSAPRRSTAIPNPVDGNLALYTVSTYSFESHNKNSEVRVLDISNGQSTLITNEEKASEPNWLGDGNKLVWLKEGDKGVTHLIVGDADKVGETYVAAAVPGPISNLKLKAVAEGKLVVAVTGKAKPDGSLYNPEFEPKKYASGLVYDSLMVRHWDKYVTPNKNTIWTGILYKSEGKYSLSDLTNPLKGTSLESPIPPFGGLDHFDVSSTGIVFVAKDPTLDPALNTKCNFYFVPLGTFSVSSHSGRPQKVEVEGFEGACSSPTFSPDGRAATFLQMKQNGYESDKNRVFLVPDLSKLSAVTEVLKSNDGKGSWDRSPSTVSFSGDGKSLYLQAEDQGRGLLYKLDIPATADDLTSLPEPLTETGYIADIRPLSANSTELFLSSTNLIDNSVYTILDPARPSEARLVSSNSRNGSSFSLSKGQVSDIWFEGSGDYKVHAWVIKPSNFDSDKKYPLAYLIHGGPQGAWGDQWSTRWNPAVFAEQGYIVITPNPTGSTGYGQAFTDAITKSWGGLPYEDLVNGFKYIKENMPYVDTAHSVALGASYGGYMMNWMQGHALGREFKALVTHDGVFSMANQMSSDEQYFPNHDLGGPYWTAMEEWEKWNPAKHTGNWSTPHLIIHNELDYRLPISEGLAAFNVLQERGVPSRFLTFPDENHWVLSEENSLLWHTVVLNWINGYAGLPPYKEDGNQGFVVQNKPPEKVLPSR